MYHHLTYEQRCQISVLLKSSSSQSKIAELIGSTQPTVSRELRRNGRKRGYCPKEAHSKATTRRHESSSADKKLCLKIALFIIGSSLLKVGSINCSNFALVSSTSI